MLDSEFYNSFRIKLFEFIHAKQHVYHDTPFHYIIYVYQGNARFTWAQDSVRINAGDFLYMPMGINYHSSWESQTDMRFLSIGFTYLPQLENMHYPMQRIEGTPESAALADALSCHLEVDCTSIGYIYQLIGCLQKRMTFAVESKKTLLVDAAERYWRQAPFASASETARYCGVGESSLYGAFRAIRGCTPVDAKHRLLCTSAVELLLGTDQSIESISEQLGFSSAAYFRKVFREQIGTSPRDVRRGGEKPRLQAVLIVDMTDEKQPHSEE